MNRVLLQLASNRLLFIILPIAILASCAPKEDLTKRALLNKPPNYLLARINNPAQDIAWLSAKASTDVEQNSKTSSFRSALKLRKDSLIWASMSPALGIEIVRAMISPDSVVYIDKLHDEFFKGSIFDLSEKVKAEVNFDQLQSLLLGMPLDFDPDDKYRSSVEGYRYVLTSQSKKKFLKVAEQKEALVDSSQSYMPGFNEKRLERLREKQEDKLIIRRYFISPETFIITEQEIVDLANEQVLEVSYSEHQEVSGVLLPHKIELKASDRSNSLRIVLDLSKIKVDQPQTMPFRIPEKYERIY